jgi:hypothetical protein
LLDACKENSAKQFFADKGELVSKHYESLGIPLPQHGAYGDANEPAPAVTESVANTRPAFWRRALNRLRNMVA